MCANLSSFNKDDDEEKPAIEQANLIGKWQSIWQRTHEIVNSKEVVTSDEAYTNGSWEFKADRTCIDRSSNETSHGTLKDNKLTIFILMAILAYLL